MFFWWRRRRREAAGEENGTGERNNRAIGADAADTAHVAEGPDGAEAAADRVLELAGRRTAKQVAPQIGMTVLALAERHGVDFASNCRRGTCARCRCQVVAGSDCLSAPNEAETARLEPDEIAAGYRLGCQARVKAIGPMRIRHAPYF